MSDTEEQTVPPPESQEEDAPAETTEEQQEQQEQEQPPAEEDEQEATPTPAEPEPREDEGEDEQQTSEEPPVAAEEPPPTEDEPAAAAATPSPQPEEQEEEDKKEEDEGEDKEPEPAQAEAEEDKPSEKEPTPTPPPVAAAAAEEPEVVEDTTTAAAEEPEQPQREGEEPAAEEGEDAGKKEEEEGEEGEAKTEEEQQTEEAKDEQAAAEEDVLVEEPVVISPEGNRYWLPVDEVLAKGLPDSEVDNFRHFYFKQAYGLQKWYDTLKDFVFPTEFITLSKEEIDALSAEGDPSEEQQTVLSGLEERINNVIELFEGDGALVRVNTRSPKDAILDKSEESFVAQVRDAVNNEQEVEKQAVCAYAVWQDQDKHPGVFKRGLTKIRESMRRKRTHSTSGKRTKLEEEKKEGEAEPKAEEAEPKTEGEEPPKEGGAEGEQAPPPAEEEGGEVTVAVTVEGNAEEPQQEAPQETPAAEEPKTEEEETPAEPASEEPKEAEQPATEEEVAEAKPAEDGEGDKKEGGEDEIQKVEEPEEKKEEKKEQPKPKSEPKRKMKPEPVDNQLVRAFGKATGALYRVKSGKAAIDMLRRSAAVRRDLNQLKAFSGVEGVLVSLSVTRWQSQVTQYAGMVFRGFVYQNELWALSQYNDTAFFPKVAYYKGTIQAKVTAFFSSQLKEALAELENYIVDFFVAPDRVYVMRLNPFYTNVGACLFTWNEHGRVLTQGPFELRVVETAKTAPECYNAFQGHWQTMFENMLEQKRVQRRPRAAGCVLL